MDLATYFAHAAPFFAGHGRGDALSSSPHLALYPRIVRATWRDTLAGLFPLTVRALTALSDDDTARAHLDAFLDPRAPRERAVDAIGDGLERFLVETRGLPAVLLDVVELDRVVRAVAQDPVVVDARRPGVNPSLVVRRFVHPVSALRDPSCAGPLPTTPSPEDVAFVRDPFRHRVRHVVLTPPRLFALARAHGEPLPPLDERGARALARGHQELILRHVLFEQPPAISAEARHE